MRGNRPLAAIFPGAIPDGGADPGSCVGLSAGTSTVSPAQTGIQNRRRLKEGGQRCASFCLGGGSGSRALLRSPGMTVLGWSDDPGSVLRLSGMTLVGGVSNSQHLWTRSVSCEPVR
jgi:hypothetical protein